MDKKQKRTIFLVTVLIAAMAFGYIAFAAPGDSSDPLVSLSYLKETVLPDILKEVDSKVVALKSTIVGELKTEIAKLVKDETVAQTYTGFKAVEVLKGQTILGREGTEIILRSGEASAVCPGENGITDTTAGLDLTNGKKIEKNHVYIIPREDGRGIKITVEGFIMVKGPYDVA